MKKLKIYLDTSVISHLFATDTPDKMSDTNFLWNDLMRGKYEVLISPVTAHELQRLIWKMKCSLPKVWMIACISPMQL